MIATEKQFLNLFTLLAATQQLGVDGNPNGQPAFQTTGRTLPQVSAVGPALQPALYMLEGEQDVMENAIATAKYELHCAAVVFFRNTTGPSTVNATQLNNLRDAVIFQMRERTLAADGVTVVPLLGGTRQQLGGVVYHARVKGRILVNEGLQNSQGALVFPISILSGM